MQKRSFTSLFIVATTAALLALTGCAEIKTQSQKIVTSVVSWGSSYMKGAPPAEEARVSAEYQKAFNTTGDSKSGIRYVIDTKSDDGPVRITLTVCPFEIIPPAAQCRNFTEAATVGGKPFPPESRRACRNNGKDWEFRSR